MPPSIHTRWTVFLLVFQRYKSYSPYDMQESIVKEVKGDLQKSFLVLGKYSQSVIPAVNSLINMNSFSQEIICQIQNILLRTCHLFSFSSSSVLWKQTTVLCQKTEWSHEGTARLFAFLHAEMWRLFFFFFFLTHLRSTCLWKCSLAAGAQNPKLSYTSVASAAVVKFRARKT